MLTEARDRDAEPLALIVDQDADTRLLYSDFLQFHHWRAIGAAAGPEALAIAIARRPDVVVTETRLPGFDGVRSRSCCGKTGARPTSQSS